ncbi:hypothetical protein HMPREF3198_00151 [Winkia neuii]|nr:hypothetical protein HMPREF3198_00151 [Winkia neuii]
MGSLSPPNISVYRLGQNGRGRTKMGFLIEESPQSHYCINIPYPN